MSRSVRADMTEEEKRAAIHRKRCARMEAIDAMPPELRALVHEYGYNVVGNCLALGLKRPNHIRHLVETILDEFSPTRGSFSRQGIHSPVEHRGEPA